MWNIVVGIVFIIGGLSGKLSLRGTNSGPALAVVGAALVIWGVVQMKKKKKEQAEQQAQALQQNQAQQNPGQDQQIKQK